MCLNWKSGFHCENLIIKFTVKKHLQELHTQYQLNYLYQIVLESKYLSKQTICEIQTYIPAEDSNPQLSRPQL